jgi:hypothetical protein
MLAVDALGQDGDRLRRDQRLLERLRRRDVGLGRAGAHGGAKSDAANRRARARRKMLLVGGILHRRIDHHDEIERRALLDLFHHLRRRRVFRHDLVAGRTLELREQLLEGAGLRAGRQHLHFSGLQLNRSEHQADRHEISRET